MVEPPSRLTSDPLEFEGHDDIGFLLALVPLWAREVRHGLSPLFYGTGTYEGDLKIKERVDKIRKVYDDARFRS